MRKDNLTRMKGGWFLGAFEPATLNTQSCEVAVKHYQKGDKEKSHYHKIATELTVIIKGQVRMGDEIFYENDIIVMEPGDTTDFEALTNTTNVVVKLPSVTNDKYIVD